MASYRVYFYGASGLICAREDFEADDNQSALETAQSVFDACSDVARRFELWCGTHMVLRPPEPIKLSDVQDRRQRAVAELEEHIRDSDWAIARSQRLLLKLSEILKDETQPRS